MSKKAFIGRKLREARMYRGKTIDVLAKETNINKKDIIAFEEDKYKPTLENEMKLSNALGFPREFFKYADNIKMTIDSTHIRPECTIPKVEQIAFKEKLAMTHRILTFLEGYIQFPQMNIPTDLNKNEDIVVEVIDTKKGANNTIKHIGIVKSGMINTGEKLSTIVDKEIRMASARNHSATHLLHKALKEVLGEHVNQAGSLVTSERLRFDVTHFEAITKEELKVIEEKVNDVILESLNITCENMSINDAKNKGAMALFGEKYGDEVRVVSMGDYSIELCGGTHLTNTSQIGMFKILSEGGVAAGVRRIEAITGRAVYNYLKEKEEIISNVCLNLKTKEDSLSQKVTSLIEENKSLSKELHDMKTKMSLQAVDSVLDSKLDVNGVNLVTTKFEGMDMNTLKEVADNLRDKLVSGVVVLANTTDDKLNLVATATKDAVDKGVHCGNIVKSIAQIAGGKGGGRPNMAQAGAPDVSKVDEALNHASEVLKSQVK